MSEKPRRVSWVKFLIVAIPVWLLLSGGVGLWLHFREEKKQLMRNDHAFQKAVDAASVADDFSKIVDVIGPRHHGSAAATVGLQRMAAMIEGALGPANMGYAVTKIPGIAVSGQSLPLLAVEVMRTKTDEEIWVICPYDSPAGMVRGADSASALAVTFAVAQAMVGKKLTRNVHFLFLPLCFDAGQDRLTMMATAQRLITRNAKTVQVLAMGSMIHPGEVTVIARDASQPVIAKAEDLLKVADDAQICLQDDAEMSAVLHEMGLPAALLLTVGEEDAVVAADMLQPSATVLQSRAVSVLQILEHLAENK